MGRRGRQGGGVLPEDLSSEPAQIPERPVVGTETDMLILFCLFSLVFHLTGTIHISVSVLVEMFNQGDMPVDVVQGIFCTVLIFSFMSS